MTAVRRSLALSAIQSYFSVALQLVSTVALSRVLTPAEVGVFAVATVFAALATNFRDFGIAEYLIQAKQLTDDNIRAAFAVNLGASWTMGLLMAGGATFVGDFYRSTQVAEVMRIQALNFAIIPFGAVTLAWFRREMNLKPLMVSSMAADTVGLCTALGLALADFGPLSLAWSSFASIAVTVAVALFYRPASFPRRPGLRGIREVLHFGSFASGIYVLGQLGRGAPEMVIGRVQGVTDVAIFSRAGGLVQLFRQLVLKAVMPVCLPYFASAVRTEQNVNRAYVRGVAIFTAIGWTFLGFLSMAAFPAIRLIYGDQWTAAVPLARILCVAGAIELVHQLGKEALLAHGAVRPASRLQLLLQLLQLAGLAAVIPFGLMGASWGLLGSALAGLVVSQLHLRATTGFSVTHLWSACRSSLQVTALALAPMAVLFASVPATEANYVRHLLAGGAATTLAWLAALRWTSHPLWAELTRAGDAVRQRLSSANRRHPDPG